MGVGKTVYKGEVETGVFAWFLDRTRLLTAAKEFPVGASLLAKRACQPTLMLSDTSPSRAGSLPQETSALQSQRRN
jgi:hypothetical protein